MAEVNTPSEASAELARVVRDMRKTAESFSPDETYSGATASEVLTEYAGRLTSLLSSHGGGGEAVDVRALGLPPLTHNEREDAEQAYTLTAFDYVQQPVGSRDWTIYWRGWWHRSMHYAPPPQPRAEGMVLVPREPTEEQWGGLARDIVMWWCFDKRTGSALYHHLEFAGREIPDWLRNEIPDADHVPPKGAVAAAIYKAMLSAAPSEGSAESVRRTVSPPAGTHTTRDDSGRIYFAADDTPPPASQSAEPHCEGHEHCEFDCIDCMDALERQRKAASQSATPSDELPEAVGDACDDILNRLEGWASAYPLSVFPEPTKEQREWIHATAPGLMDRISASMGRHMAGCIADDLAKLKAAIGVQP